MNYYEKYTVVEDKFLNNTLCIDHLKELQDGILNCLNYQSNVLILKTNMFPCSSAMSDSQIIFLNDQIQILYFLNY
jgi:hypothetical protein